MLDNTRLRIAIQKSGRLSEDSRELLSRCGIKVNLHTQRLIALAENMPIDILRVRDDDIPGLGDGRCCRPRYYRRKRAGRRAAQPPRPRAKTRATSPCAVSTSAAAACRWRLRWMKHWNGPAALDGKRIATSYPHLLKRYLDQKVSPLNPVC